LVKSINPQSGFSVFIAFPTDVRCHVAIIKENDGAFSAIVLNLPGTGSCGDSSEEALANLQDAVKETIAAYDDAGEDVPWITEYEVPQDAITKWILVNA
jgi:predicted RNase H-like HicB family nuclease